MDRGRPGAAQIATAFAAAVIAAALPAGALAERSETPAPTFGTGDVNDSVTAIHRDGDRIYIAGKFTHLGPVSGPGAIVDLDQGRWLAPALDIRHGSSASVAAAIPDGEGGFFVGGQFEAIGGLDRAGVAHVLASGDVDPNWDAQVMFAAGLGGIVRTFELVDGHLLIGGSFRTVGGQPRRNVASVAAATGEVETLLADADPQGGVEGLAADGDRVYIVGGFHQVGGLPRTGAAALALEDGAALPNWDPVITGAGSATVDEVTVAGGRVFVGGLFDEVDGTPRISLAALRSDGEVDSSWDAGIEFEQGRPWVTALAIDRARGRLIVSGSFVTVQEQTRHGLAAVALSNAQLDRALAPMLLTAEGRTAYARDLAIDGNWLYAAGSFEQVDGRDRGGFATIALTDGTVGRWDPNTGPSAGVVAVGRSKAGRSHAFVGGWFATINRVAQAGLAALDAQTGALIESFRPETYSLWLDSFATIATRGDRVYVGGDFAVKEGKNWRARQAAAFDARTGARDLGFAPPLYFDRDSCHYNGPVSGPHVSALLFDRDRLLIGGCFAANGSRRHESAIAVDPVTGRVDDRFDIGDIGFNGNGEIRDLDLVGSDLFVAGRFRRIGTPLVQRMSIARVDAETGALDPGFEPPAWAERYVYAVTHDDERVYLGGMTFQGAGIDRNGAVALDRATGAFEPAFDPHFPNFAQVRGVEILDDRLYAAGLFTMIAGAERRGIGAVSLTDGALLPWNPRPDFSPWVYDLTTDGERLYAGGSFLRWGSGVERAVLQSGFAVFDETG